MYERGQIYAIIDEEGMEVYIGSTCNELYKRWNGHKGDAIKKPNVPIYKYIMENGGFEKFRIVLVEDFPCTCKKELLRREGEVIKAINPIGNRKIAGRTNAEWREDNKERIQERDRKYYEQNRKKIRECQREYYEQNKEMNLERLREYYEQNRKRIREYQREYHQKNKEKICERHRENYRKKENEL